MVTTASRMFDQHHGKHLKRERVVRGLVSKILDQHTEFVKKVITKIIRVRTFARQIETMLNTLIDESKLGFVEDENSKSVLQTKVARFLLRPTGNQGKETICLWSL